METRHPGIQYQLHVNRKVKTIESQEQAGLLFSLEKGLCKKSEIRFKNGVFFVKFFKFHFV